MVYVGSTWNLKQVDTDAHRIELHRLQSSICDNLAVPAIRKLAAIDVGSIGSHHERWLVTAWD
jgi:hypothetical protein